MAKVAIVTDGVNDLSEEMIKEYDISVVPYRVIFGEEIYRVWSRDRYTLSTEDFVQKLSECTKQNLPHTSLPSPGEFVQVFEEALKKADSVIACLISQKLSGACQSAKRVVEAHFPDKDITVFDTAQTMAGTGILALEAARMAKNGETKEEILARLEALRDEVQFIMIIPDLEYFYLQGRIGRAKKLLGMAFNKIPVVNMKDGVINSVGSFSGKKHLVEQMKKFTQKVVKLAKTNDIFLSYVSLKEETDQIYETIKAYGNGLTIHKYQSSSIIGVYTGFEVIAFCYIGEWNKEWLLK